MREGELAFSRQFRKELAAFDVTVAQYQHLRQLFEGDGLSQGELSRQLGVESASSTATLDSLERQQLIRRVRNRSDRRKVNVFLTSKGRALRGDLIECARRTNIVATEGLTDAQVKSFFITIRHVLANLRKHENDSSADNPDRR